MIYINHTSQLQEEKETKRKKERNVMLMTCETLLHEPALPHLTHHHHAYTVTVI